MSPLPPCDHDECPLTRCKRMAAPTRVPRRLDPPVRPGDIVSFKNKNGRVFRAQDGRSYHTGVVRAVVGNLVKVLAAPAWGYKKVAVVTEVENVRIVERPNIKLK